MKRHSIVAMALGAIATLSFNQKNIIIVEDNHDPNLGLFGIPKNNSYWNYPSPIWFPSRSRRIKNKIMKKQLCKL